MAKRVNPIVRINSRPIYKQEVPTDYSGIKTVDFTLLAMQLFQTYFTPYPVLPAVEDKRYIIHYIHSTIRIQSNEFPEAYDTGFTYDGTHFIGPMLKAAYFQGSNTKRTYHLPASTQEWVTEDMLSQYNQPLYFKTSGMFTPTPYNFPQLYVKLFYSLES